MNLDTIVSDLFSHHVLLFFIDINIQCYMFGFPFWQSRPPITDMPWQYRCLRHHLSLTSPYTQQLKPKKHVFLQNASRWIPCLNQHQLRCFLHLSSRLPTAPLPPRTRQWPPQKSRSRQCPTATIEPIFRACTLPINVMMSVNSLAWPMQVTTINTKTAIRDSTTPI